MYIISPIKIEIKVSEKFLPFFLVSEYFSDFQRYFTPTKMTCKILPKMLTFLELLGYKIMSQEQSLKNTYNDFFLQITTEKQNPMRPNFSDQPGKCYYSFKFTPQSYNIIIFPCCQASANIILCCIQPSVWSRFEFKVGHKS